MNGTDRSPLTSFDSPVESSNSTQNIVAPSPPSEAISHRTGETILLEDLRRQAEFGKALSKLSATFIKLAVDRVDGEIENGLATLSRAMGGDRATIAVIHLSSGELVVTHSWARPGFPPFPKGSLKNTLPWLSKRLKMGETIVANRLEDLPPEASLEKNHIEALGIKSTLIVPMRIEGKLIGAAAMSTRTSFCEREPWNDSTVSQFQTAADVFANALTRKQADEMLHRAYTEIQSLKEQLERENSYLRQEINLEYSHVGVVGNSAAMCDVLKKAEQVAGTDSTVLILGETGTGKELIARTIHEMSKRNKRSMVKTNCAALPASIIESELFGRERGAYTGALAREIGRFELADHSTIFLDEIGELPPEVQSKLLRVLQEGEFERLGSPRTVKVNVRVIAATSRDLQTMAREGKFRNDLFYRLNVFPIVIPPLRERSNDIPALVWHILKDLGQRMGRNIEVVHASTMQAFQKYSWPGNVRELRNVIERYLILNSGSVFRAEVPVLEQKLSREMRHIDDVESEYFLGVLQATGWRIRGQRGAAEILGVKPTTLEARMKKLGICRPK
jgi:formate hydrogenlyase transcriptional activator